MKKFLTLIAVALLMASPAMAANVDISAGTSLGSTNTLYSASSNVTVLATATDTAYGVAAKHTNGTTGYSSADTETEITETASQKGHVPTAITSAGVATFAAGS